MGLAIRRVAVESKGPYSDREVLALFTPSAASSKRGRSRGRSSALSSRQKTALAAACRTAEAAATSASCCTSGSRGRRNGV